MTRDEEPRPSATVIELSPRRLREGDGPAAAAARAFHAETATIRVDEAWTWRRLALELQHKAIPERRGWRLLLAGALEGATAVAVVCPGVRPPPPPKGQATLVASPPIYPSYAAAGP